MIRVRDAAKGDAARLVELHAGVHELHAGQRPDVFVGEPDQARVEAFFHGLVDEPAVHVLVAEAASDGSVVGYAVARVVEREAGLHVHRSAAMKLEHLAVDPVASRGGVGSALLEAVRERGRAAGCRRLHVNVWSFNTSARSFYEARGLVPMKQQLEQDI